MPTELEAKMKAPDLAAIRARLQEFSAISKGIKHETNIFFDTDDDNLLRRGSGMRIRIARDNAGIDHCTITFKGPLQPSQLKSREEIEFSIDKPAAGQALFDNLGYREKLRFEKKRESWEFNACKIELDDLPQLGTFVEIEGNSTDEIMSVRKQLGLADSALITESYASMIAGLKK